MYYSNNEKFKTKKNIPEDSNEEQMTRQNAMRSQLEWIKRQLEYASYSEKFSLHYNLKRGEIYEIDWGLNVNAEFSNRHYGVVMADSDENNPLVTVCPLKTNHSGINKNSDVDLGYIKDFETGNKTIAVVNQIRTVDKLRIYLRRLIGLNDSGRKYSSNYEAKYYIMRLENDKLNMIVEAYKRYLSGENIN